jgi:hypothetical protein
MICLPQEAYEDFERDIVPLIRALHWLNIPTHESCEGHLDPSKDPFPYIYIDVFSISDSNDLLRLFELLILWNQERGIDRQWVVTEFVLNDEEGLLHLFLLRPFNQNKSRTLAILRRFQRDATDLAGFIRQVYPEPI